MEKLEREIWNDYKNGHTYAEYTFHDKELGYDTFFYTLEDGNLIISQILLEDDKMLTGVNMFKIRSENFEDFERTINSCIYYIPLEEQEEAI